MAEDNPRNPSGSEQRTTPTRLPIVRYEGQEWFFDERLRQLRNIHDPFDYQNLNEFEMFYFQERVAAGRFR